jgi:iodotyrosine deiodinase
MPDFIPYQPLKLSPEDQQLRAKEFYVRMAARRSVRTFSPASIPHSVLDDIIRTAGTAPSGANKQPWTFVVVTDPETKKKIRIAAEEEERESYEHRMPQEWLEDLAVLGTDWHKEFLDVAPALIVVFAKSVELIDQQVKKNYYVKESVGIACGLLIAAIHNAGLVALTHTPSPMDFLVRILKRPENEKPFLLIPVGFAADETSVPDIQRKSLSDIMIRR